MGKKLIGAGLAAFVGAGLWFVFGQSPSQQFYREERGALQDTVLTVASLDTLPLGSLANWFHIKPYGGKILYAPVLDSTLIDTRLANRYNYGGSFRNGPLQNNALTNNRFRAVLETEPETFDTGVVGALVFQPDTADSVRITWSPIPW